MPETNIERTIFKLELDGSAYIQGVDALSNSTKKLSAEQEKSNEALKKAEANLKSQATYLQQAKKDLESYTGTNETYRQQLKKSFDSASSDNQKLTETVNKNKLAYDAATKAAQNFANISSKASTVKQPGIQTPTSGITQQIAGVLNVADFTKQALIIEQTKNEFDDLRVSIGLAEARMKQLNATDAEFQQLAPIVEQGKKALQQYDQAAEQAGGKTLSLRSQLRLAREELVKLEQAGQGASKQYIELEKRTAKLTDQFGDQQQRIKTLSSDTKALDFGKGAITAATSAFQAYTAVSILAGGESEELQKKTLQLFAAMQLLQSLEQLSNLTRREGVLGTLAGSAAQSVYTTVVGASTGALKAFRLALAATGIGAAIVLIGYLVSKWQDLKEAEEKAAFAQKTTLEISKKAVDVYAQEVTHIKLLAGEYKNLNTSAQRKKEIQDELQKSYPSYFADLDKHADKEKYIAEQTDKVTQALIIQAKIQGAQSLLAEKFQALLKKQFDPAEAVGSLDIIKATIANTFGNLGDAGESLSNSATRNIKTAETEYNQFNTFIQNLVNGLNAELDTLGGDPKKQADKVKAATKGIENDFLKKKAELDARLAALQAKEAQDEASIRAQFAAALRKEQLEIDKNKNLTKPQKGILKNELVDINNIELKKALDDFNKKIKDARQKLNDELRSLEEKNNQDTLNLIKDEFDRRAQLIFLNEKTELQNAQDLTKKRILDLDEQHKVNLINEEDYQNAKALIISAGEQQASNILQRFAVERQKLSEDLFQNLLNAYQQAINNSDLIFTQSEAKAVRALSDKFLAGKISREKFEEGITKIQKDAENDRKSGALQVEKDELQALDNELSLIEDKYSEHYKKLKKQRDDFALKVAQDEINDAKDISGDNTKNNVENVQQYAQAIGAIADSVIAFWQAANEAESKALDRSISLQEKRVSAAQRIADRGNAQYLKAEEDRLTELNVKRENAARKQLGIDAALQASQILVGITGAISKIGSGIGIAETVAEIAVIIGALATGYGLVKSLQGNQPKLAKGDKYVKRNGAPSGIDTIPAWLNEGEAVIPTDKNKAYHPTVAAIYDGTIPADHMNNFVKNYHQIKRAPQPNYDKIKDTAELHISMDGKMAVLLTEQNRKIEENNDLQRQTLRAMKSMSVSANIDRDGVAIMVNEYIGQMKISKRT